VGIQWISMGETKLKGMNGSYTIQTRLFLRTITMRYLWRINNGVTEIFSLNHSRAEWVVGDIPKGAIIKTT